MFICLAAMGPPAYGGGTVDKSGLRPQVLKLPSGPGSITGLGESFDPQLNSGTASYRVPLRLPPGRAGFSPALAIVYNGGRGNSELGIGWRLSAAYIQRQTDKGLPVYDDSKDRFITEAAEELVCVGSGFYRHKNEQTFDRYERTGDGWAASHRDGSRSYYGLEPSARVRDGSNVYRWAVSRQEDRNGNWISYHYNEGTAFAAGVAPSDGQVYLTSIIYNQTPSSGQAMRVELKYTRRLPHDCLFDYRSRFPVQTTQRCVEVIMLAGNQRAGSYRLRYDPEAMLSRLSRVELYGRNEAAGPLESILTFAYTEFELNTTLTAMDGGFNPDVGLTLANVDLADMNGDALPDVIHTGQVHEVFLNRGGTGWDGSYEVEGGFGEIQLSQANTMLMDMDGDGAADLFGQDRSIDGYRYFKGGRSNGGWDLVPVEMANSPEFTFGDTTRPVDLDNDGQTDVLRKNELGSEITCVFNQKGAGWSGEFTIDAPSTRSEFNFGPEASSALRLADMNGDGLQDFVVLHAEGEIWYYPGHGVTLDPATPVQYQGWDSTVRGAWEPQTAGAEGYRMANAPDSLVEPDFAEIGNFRRLRILDVNGDGLNDLVYVANNRLLLWLNLGGHAFSSAHTIPSSSGQIPDQDVETGVRTVDMNGNGTVDVVWNRQSGFSEIDHAEASWVYLDLTAGVRPNLLKRLDNGIGQVTAIQYRSSTDYRVADRQSGKLWAYRLPFPVQVVSRIDVMDGRGGVYIREMAYHDGYYDGTEKEFRGFARAEQQEVGDTSAPDLVMAYVYNVGAEQEPLKGKPLALEARTMEGEVFYRETYDWLTRKLADGAEGDDRDVVYPYQSAKMRDVLERGNGSPVRLKWEYEYDDYGNLTRQMEHGRMDAGWNDERVTETTYTSGFPGGRSLWILDRVVSRTTRDPNGALVAQKRHYYDDHPTLGTVTKGNLTRVEDWVAPGKIVTSVRNDYDAYGNITAIYDPLYGSKPGHYRQIRYDETYQVFPVKEIIHTGSEGVPELMMSASYDFGFGVMTSSTDFNGFTTRYGLRHFWAADVDHPPPRHRSHHRIQLCARPQDRPGLHRQLGGNPPERRQPGGRLAPLPHLL
jgi:hypothetical protein